MKANPQTAYLATAPSIFADFRFMDFAVARTVLERPSETIAAIIKTKAAIMTFGKYPSTLSFKKEETSYKPTKLREGRRKTIITNHFTTSPTKCPVFRLTPALRKKFSAPIDLKRLSILRLSNTCSMARAIKEPKTQPTTKKTTATISFGANCTKLHQRVLSASLKTSPQVSQILFIIVKLLINKILF